MASMSGIKLAEGIKEFHESQFKQGKKHAFYTCMIVDIMVEKGGKQVPSEEVQLGTKGSKYEKGSKATDEDCRAAFEELRKSLEADKPCFCFFDFVYNTDDGIRTKIAFLYWCLDSDAPIKKKMKYSATETMVRNVLSHDKAFKISDKDDLNYDSIIEDLRKSSK